MQCKTECAAKGLNLRARELVREARGSLRAILLYAHPLRLHLLAGLVRVLCNRGRDVNLTHGPPCKSMAGRCSAGTELCTEKEGSGSGAAPPRAMLRVGLHPEASCDARQHCTLSESKVSLREELCRIAVVTPRKSVLAWNGKLCGSRQHSAFHAMQCQLSSFHACEG